MIIQERAVLLTDL